MMTNAVTVLLDFPNLHNSFKYIVLSFLVPTEDNPAP
jgi:hypothetical protein